MTHTCSTWCAHGLAGSAHMLLCTSCCSLLQGAVHEIRDVRLSHTRTECFRQHSLRDTGASSDTHASLRLHCRRIARCTRRCVKRMSSCARCRRVRAATRTPVTRWIKPQPPPVAACRLRLLQRRSWAHARSWTCCALCATEHPPPSSCQPPLHVWSALHGTCLAVPTLASFLASVACIPS